MRSNSITFRAVLALLLFGFVLAVGFVGESDPAAARGFGRGGGRSFGGMRGGGSHHEMTRRMNQSSSRTGHDTSNKRAVSRDSNSNKSSTYSKTTTTQGNGNTSTSNEFGTNAGSRTTAGNTSTSNTSTTNAGTSTTNTQGSGNYSTVNRFGGHTGSRTTNTPGAVNTSTANTSTANAGLKTTTTTGNTSTSNGSSTGNTSTANNGSRAGSTPGTNGNSTSNAPGTTTISSTGTGSGTVANAGSSTSDTPRGGGRIPGSQLPNVPRGPVGLGGGAGSGAGAGSGTGGGGGGGAGGGANVASSGVPPRNERRYVPDEVIAEFSSIATPQSIDQLARRYNLTRLDSQSFPLIGTTIYRWHINGRRSVPDTIGAIEDQRVVARAQPNYLFTLQADATTATTKTRGGDSAQYALGKLQIERAHQVATGKDIPIALIDSEIDVKHPDLNGAITKSFDPLGGDAKPHPHGTAMAGAIAAHGKLSGIALGPHLLAARAFDNTAGEAKGTSFAIYKSLQWAADNGARVINMSFAGPADPDMHRMLAAAYEKGIVLVAAAGNAGPNSPPLYPAADPDVIAVTATDSNDGLFKMANRGSYIAVAAPGVEILALAPGDSYQITTGTSVAAAHVSGIAAMLLEEKPSLTPNEVRSIIMSTAKPLGSAGQRSDFGAGLVDAYQAVSAVTNGKPAGKQDAEQAKE